MGKKILYTAFDVYPFPKGSGTHIYYFTKLLREGGHDVTLLVRNRGDQPNEELIDGIHIYRVNLDTYSTSNSWQRYIGFGTAALEFAQQHAQTIMPFEVIHSRSIWEGLPLSIFAQANNVPFVFELNGLPSIELPYEYLGLENSQQGQALLAKIHQHELATLLNARVIICVSEVTRTFLISKGIPRNRICLIRNGVDTDMFVPRSETVPQNHPPYLLYQGIPADWQGLRTLVSAVGKFPRSERPMIRIVGARSLRHYEDLLHLATTLGVEDSVSFETSVPFAQVPSLIAESFACVAPLASDVRNLVQGCCPIKILEYMSCAKPVIAPDLSVVRELMSNGTHGFLYSADNAEALASAIKFVFSLNNVQLNEIGNRARAHICNNLTWEIAGTKLYDLYSQL